jgi:hypothetical protein
MEGDRVPARLVLLADRGSLDDLEGQVAGLELAAADFPVVEVLGTCARSEQIPAVEGSVSV